MPRSSSRSAKSTAALRALKDLTREIQRAPGFPEVVAALKNGQSATVDGAWGSASALVAAALALHAPSTLVILLAHVGDVDDFRDDVATFAGIVPEVFPAWELPRELNAVDEVFGRRMRVLKKLASATPPRLVVAPFQATLQPVPKPEVLARMSRTVAVGEAVPVETLTAWMLERGMSRAEVVEVPGEFSVARRNPRRLSDRRDRPGPHRVLRRRDRVDPPVRRRIAALARPLELGHADGGASASTRPTSASFGHPVDYFPEGTWVALLEPTDLREEGRHYLGRLEDQRGLFTRRSQLRAADPLSHDRGLDARGRLARDDLPPADREHRAVLGRADQGQGRARQRGRRRKRLDRLPQRGRGRAAGRGLLRHRAGRSRTGCI